jgi:hypothetical protein
MTDVLAAVHHDNHNSRKTDGGCGYEEELYRRRAALWEISQALLVITAPHLELPLGKGRQAARPGAMFSLQSD